MSARSSRLALPLLAAALIVSACAPPAPEAPPPPAPPERIRLIVDSDANNELDDQFALTYALHNQDVFDLEGITVNHTRGGGNIQLQYDEAERIIALSARTDVPLYMGAAGSYTEIVPTLGSPDFDGHAAVDFIIERAHADDPRPLVLAPIGKLTNIALALEKDPSIASKIKIHWLGSHWPMPGEYNLDNDTTSVNPVIASGAPFDMALVRFGYYSGTGAVKLGLKEVQETMPGLGPRIAQPITGRHGGEFYTFGDYAVSLYTEMGEDYRALYDLAALAVLKNPDWAERVVIDAPRLSGEAWVEVSPPRRQIAIWENFNTSLILKDLYATLEAASR
ncbi:MAG: nucleoside hydrolase [Rhodothermales bacterium]